MNIFEIFGIAGVIFITIGILLKNRKTQDIFFIIGGITLALYSIYLKNTIYITLQIIFTIAAIYDIIKLQLKSKSK